METKQQKRLKEIMIQYQETFESDEDHVWTKNVADLKQKMEELDTAAYQAREELMYAIQDMAFVEGVCFAMDVMDLSGSGGNRELLKQLLKELKGDKDG